jgi:hypothetical protein
LRGEDDDVDLDGYQQFSHRVQMRLAAMPEVLGLIATGSMAGGEREPDEWSDHDFWIVAEAGTAARLRMDPSFLPAADRIVLHFRETPEGTKVLYDDGHLVEYAVFEPDGLELARVNHYLVLVDRERIAQRVEARRAATQEESEAMGGDVAYLTGQFLTGLLVGVGRYRRGERLSGGEFVKQHAITHLLRLIAATAHPSLTGDLDDIDPRRRFEAAFPEEAAAIQTALSLPTDDAARALLEMAERRFADHLPGWPAPASAVVRCSIATHPR